MKSRLLPLNAKKRSFRDRKFFKRNGNSDYNVEGRLAGKKSRFPAAYQMRRKVSSFVPPEKVRGFLKDKKNLKPGKGKKESTKTKRQYFNARGIQKKEVRWEGPRGIKRHQWYAQEGE